MPPGMMVVLGTAFKLLPIRLGVARWISWAMLATGYVCCICWIGRLKRGLLAGVLLSLFFLNGAFTAAGNIARMDAWIWGISGLAFAILHSSKTGWQRRLAWTLLGCSPLVHPNGLYFLFAAGLAETGCRIVAKWDSSGSEENKTKGGCRRELPWIVLVIVVWMAYGVFVKRNWMYFVEDMAWQFSSNMNIHTRDGFQLPHWALACLIGYLLWGVYALLRNPRTLWLIGWGGANLTAYVIRREMWYEIFWQTGWLWLVVLGFQLEIPLRGKWKKVASVLASCLLFGWAGGYFLKHGFIEGPRGYFQELSWGWGMKLENEGAYITSEDVACLKAQLEQAAHDAGRPIRVEFYPSGDQLLVMKCFNDWIRPFCPIFTNQKADCTVVHVSRYRPSWLDVRGKIPAGSIPFYARDDSEQWYFSWEQPTRISP